VVETAARKLETERIVRGDHFKICTLYDIILRYKTAEDGLG
jgi:hypothetical protein